MKRIERDGVVHFGFFKLDDARLGDAKPACELSGGHAEGVADRAKPTLGRALSSWERAQGGETLVEMADSFFHAITYSL